MRHLSKKQILYVLFLAAAGLTTNQCTNGSNTKIKPLEDNSYRPDQPIEFPHEIHTSKGIDCKYCHNSEIDGKTKGIPMANICMNCHESKDGNKPD